jgi:hypothetical protein
MPGGKPASRSGPAFARILEGGAEFGEREFAYDSRGQRITQIEAAGAFIAKGGANLKRLGALAHRGLHIVAGWHGFSPFLLVCPHDAKSRRKLP